MMKIIVAPDSFKGSISAADAAAAIARGVREALPAAEVTEMPIADGGEGTLDATVPKSARAALTVTGTDCRPIRAEIGFIGETAVIEMASAAGLCIVPESDRNPEKATTYGVGQLVSAALDRGFRRLMITVGGSGTNDGGSGMLEALGAKFSDRKGNRLIGMCGGKLAMLGEIDISGLDRRLYDCEITFACDVTNPLLGEHGATYTYGSQKGADPSMLLRLELGMKNYASVLSASVLSASALSASALSASALSASALSASSHDIASIPGTGAGGGLPAPLVALCGATIKSGIASVLEAVGFDRALDRASLVITGEGKIDAQSACGKAISGISSAASAAGVPVIALVGKIGSGAEKMKECGLFEIYALTDIAPSAEYAVSHAGELLTRLARETVKKYI